MKKTTDAKKGPSLAGKAMKKINQFGKKVGAKVDSVTDGLKQMVDSATNRREPAMVRIDRSDRVRFSRKTAPKR